MAAQSLVILSFVVIFFFTFFFIILLLSFDCPLLGAHFCYAFHGFLSFIYLSSFLHFLLAKVFRFRTRREISCIVVIWNPALSIEEGKRAWRSRSVKVSFIRVLGLRVLEAIEWVPASYFRFANLSKHSKIRIRREWELALLRIWNAHNMSCNWTYGNLGWNHFGIADKSRRKH
jgi:hypothetical protein